MAIVGYAMVFTLRHPAAQYAGTIVVAAGLLPSVACHLAWTGSNFGGEVKRAVIITMVVGCGNLGGCVPACGALNERAYKYADDAADDVGRIVASFIYRQQDSPQYLPGHAVCIGSLCVL